jgi:hypothetical protein
LPPLGHERRRQATDIARDPKAIGAQVVDLELAGEGLLQRHLRMRPDLIGHADEAVLPLLQPLDKDLFHHAPLSPPLRGIQSSLHDA